jgi:hypothetical protein
MSHHQPRRPDAMVTDGAPADHHGQGWSLPCSGVVLCDDMEGLPADGSGHRPLSRRSLSASSRMAGRQASGRTTSAASSRQARESREYVRRLLKEKQPEFAAALEAVKRELCQGFHADL